MNSTRTDVAIVGMAGRFPGADSVEQLWHNLLDGVESVERLSPEQLRAAGVPEATVAQPSYVPAAAELSDAAAFDAELFGIPAHEARLMDPQQRVFLECAWAALEDAGYSPPELTLRAGVFGSTSVSSYLINVLTQSEGFAPGEVNYPVLLGNDKDFLASRVSYKLRLTGPSMTVQTACSSSLTAVHLACQSLLRRECSLALAGGVSISVPQGHGYLYREGGILSVDGHCRVFDAAASGTVKGSGCGVVVLRLLEDAQADGDHVYAVIRGTAINNDGADKVGFTAPSSAGQEEVIREAMQVAAVPAADIGYVEAHGTGTPMGDPIELRALAAAHRADGPPPRRCVVGSVKANVGHLDAASGVTGLIKTALVLRDQMIPGQPTFATPNPALGLEGSPYQVLTKAKKPATDIRAAAVSSFGLGGTNAHAVLVPADDDSRPAVPAGRYQILLSAVDQAALDDSVRRLRDWLVDHPGLRIDDLALTLARGRRAMSARLAVAAGSTIELLASLDQLLAGRSAPLPDPVQDAWMSGDDTAATDVGNLSRARRSSLPGTAFRRVRHWAAQPTDDPRTVPDAGVRPGSDVQQSASPAGAALTTSSALARILAVLSTHLATEVAPDEDIFDLGVDSMTLVEIVTDLRDALGVPVRFEDAEQARSARQLADLLAPRASGGKPPGPSATSAVAVSGDASRPALDLTELGHLVVPVRTGQGDRNVFLVHPAGGTTICYVDLARKLRGPDSIYGVGFPAELVERPQSIRALARLYVALIRRTQPVGPYVLGGYSFGGNVAFEMALLLEAEGEHVAEVMMFDSHPPEAYLGGDVSESSYVAAFPVLVRSLFPELQHTPDVHNLTEVLDAVRLDSWSPPMMRDLETFFEVWRHNHRALKRYYPDAQLQAGVTMFEAAQAENRTDLERLGIRVVGKESWRQHVAGGFRVVSVPGNHFSMFRDPGHLQRLAAALDQTLGPPRLNPSTDCAQ